MHIMHLSRLLLLLPQPAAYRGAVRTFFANKNLSFTITAGNKVNKIIIVIVIISAIDDIYVRSWPITRRQGR